MKRKRGVPSKQLWKEFATWGSGWTLESEREYAMTGDPLVFHIRMAGMFFPAGNEFASADLSTLLRRVIRSGKRQQRKWEKTQEPT